MSLSLRLTLLVLVSSLVMLLAVTYFALQLGKSNVDEEISANSRLTMQLVTTAILGDHGESTQERRSLLTEQLTSLDDVRHLDLSLIQADGTRITPYSELQAKPAAIAPQWFTNWLEPRPTEYRRRLASPVFGNSEIVLTPDASAEIGKAWQQFKITFVGITTGTVIFIGLMIILIRWTLKPLPSMEHAIQQIQKGDFTQRLPEPGLPELGVLSNRVNQMTQVLENQRTRNIDLSRKLLALQEDEQRRLSRELHDELGQSISAIKAMTASLEANNQNKKILKEIVNVCDQMYGQVRLMMNRLRPVVLEELGLGAALERLVDKWNDQHESCFCSLEITDSSDLVSRETALVLYRVAQEALTNVSRHARANQVSIKLITNPEQCSLEIKDDGQGFNPEIMTAGIGLAGMRERVFSLSGQFDMESSPGQGVNISVVLPQKAG